MIEPRSYRATDPLRWTPRTLADELREQGREVSRRVACGCGVERPPDAIVDVRPLASAIRGRAEWACDVCWTGWIRTGRLTRDQWLAALGAPPELRARLARKPDPYAGRLAAPTVVSWGDQPIDGATSGL